MREGLIRLEIKCLFLLFFFFWYVYVCKNSEARWSQEKWEKRQPGVKGGESVSCLTSPAHPGWTGVLQTPSIPAAHQQPPHIPCGCPRRDRAGHLLSAQCSVEAFHACRASHLHHLIFSSSTLVPLLPPSTTLFYLSVTIGCSQQVTGITSISVTPLVFTGGSPQECCPHRDILPHRL